MQPARFTLWIIWGTLLASLGIYAALPLLVTPAGEGMGEGARILTLCLVAVAVATAAATFILKRVLVVAPVARGEMDAKTPRGAQRIQLGYVVCWALAESIGVYGLVLYFLTHSVTTMLPFIVGSALLLVAHAPRAADSERAHDSPELAQRPDPIG